MSKSVEQLILVLTKECEAFRDYLALAKKKKDIIISGHVKELDNITKIEQDMIITMGKIGQLRTNIIGNLLKELNIESVETLSELAGYLEESWKSKVMSVKENLEQAVREVKELNELNGSLIKQSLDYIDFNMNLMLKFETKGSTYGSKADEKEIKQRSTVFDVKI